MFTIKKHITEFISTKRNPKLIDEIHKILLIPKEYIKKNGSAWMVDINKSSNYDTLNSKEKNLDDQLNVMIGLKYQFIVIMV